MSALPACCVRHKCASLTLSVVLATLLLAVSIGAPIFLTRLLRAGIRDSIALTPLAQRDATKAWQSWSDSRNAEARPLTMSAHLFNVTNPLEAAGGAPIVLREIGPFVFNEFKIRSNFSWGSATTSSGASVSTLSYTEQVYYLFDRAHTPAALSLDTLITAPNLPFITALTLGPDVAILLGYDCFDTPEAPFAKSSRCLFRSRRAVDLIFGFTPTDESLPWIGLLKNDTTSPLPSTIITGYDSASGELDANAAAQFRHFTAWEGSSQSLAPVSPLTARDHSTWRPPWNTTAANRVGGSEGIQNAPSLDLSAPLSVYTHPLFRQMTLEASPAPPFLLQHRPTSSDPCAEPVDPTPAAFTYEGIDLSHFQLAASVFQNASANPANMAYFAFGVPSGILNTTKCFAGLQLFVSPPHFLNVDHTPLTQRVHGLAPSYAPTLH